MDGGARGLAWFVVGFWCVRYVTGWGCASTPCYMYVSGYSECAWTPGGCCLGLSRSPPIVFSTIMLRMRAATSYPAPTVLLQGAVAPLTGERRGQGDG